MKQTREQFHRMISDTFDHIHKLSQGKGAEYTGDKQDENEHENFDRLSVRLGLLPEQVLMVYLSKHLDSIDTYVARLASPLKTPDPSEPIDGRIDDAILYLLLLKGMYKRRLDSARDVYIGPNAIKAICANYREDSLKPSFCINCGWGKIRHCERDQKFNLLQDGE